MEEFKESKDNIPEVDRRIIELKTSTIKELEEKIQSREEKGFTSEVVKKQLERPEVIARTPIARGYIEFLHQEADLKRLKGEPIDKELNNFFREKDIHIFPKLSLHFSKKILNSIRTEDDEIIEKLLKHGEFLNRDALSNLKSENEIKKALKLCKNNPMHTKFLLGKGNL